MTFFIEDYFEKHQKYLKGINKFQSYQEYRNAIDKSVIQRFYHPYYIKSWEWDKQNLPSEVAKEINARFGNNDREKKYKEILFMDRLLVLLLNAKTPCYLNDILTKYRDEEDFLKSFFAIFFGPIVHVFNSLVLIFSAIYFLLRACIYTMTRTRDDVKDDLILACYSFSISLIYALHILLAPPITIISFFTRFIVTVNSRCNQHNKVSEKDSVDDSFTLVSNTR
jgi:hypothetical protein